GERGLRGGLRRIRAAGPNQAVFPSLPEALLVALQPLDADVEHEHPFGIERPDERQHRDVLMSEPAEVLGGAARGGAVVDADERRRRVTWLVDSHHRELAFERRRHAAILFGRPSDDEPAATGP